MKVVLLYICHNYKVRTVLQSQSQQVIEWINWKDVELREDVGVGEDGSEYRREDGGEDGGKDGAEFVGEVDVGDGADRKVFVVKVVIHVSFLSSIFSFVIWSNCMI